MAQTTTLSVRRHSWRDAPALTAWTIQEEPSTRISWTPRAPVRPRRLRKPECRELLNPNNALPGIHIHGIGCRCLQAQADEELQDELLATKIASLTRTILAPTIASSEAPSSSSSSSSTTDSTKPSPSNRLRRSRPGTGRPAGNISLPLQADLTIGCADLDIDKVARYLLPITEEGSSTNTGGAGRPRTAGVDVNARNHHGTTPLMAAVRSPFGAGAGAGASASLPGAAAAAAGAGPLRPRRRRRRPRAQREMVRFLVEACGADVEAARVDRVTGAGETVLSMACAAGATEVVRFLLGSGARADRRLPSARGIGSGSGGSSGSGTGAAPAVTTTTTPLLTGRGQTALHVAVLADRPECVEVLLREGGADANAVFDAAGPDLDTAGGGKGEKAEKEKAPKHPVSALHLAAHASPECARLLLEHGARVDIRDAYGRTPLHWAAEAGHGAVVRLLVEAGANINAELPVARPGSRYCGQDLGWFGKETYEALNESG
ncbi:ankyrin repeat-containing domain protein [Thermothelomyces heterothallicus CBS 202.75]|uniref:ankyrin repeat-containing domain protein n=1 Tax=Thermothelomyces heterothallicus CBS 202.75 TaxID=1149848 RepID=UPI0037420822